MSSTVTGRLALVLSLDRRFWNMLANADSLAMALVLPQPVPAGDGHSTTQSGCVQMTPKACVESAERTGSPP